MAKYLFLAVEDRYIASVAATAGISSKNVVILNIVEISTRSHKIIGSRLLLTISVSVQTSVQVPYRQQAYIKNQSLLNSILIKNGLPSSTLVIDSLIPSPTTSVSATPAPASSPASSDAVLIGATIGGVATLFILLTVVLYWKQILLTLAALCWRRVEVCYQQSAKCICTKRMYSFTQMWNKGFMNVL